MIFIGFSMILRRHTGLEHLSRVARGWLTAGPRMASISLGSCWPGLKAGRTPPAVFRGWPPDGRRMARGWVPSVWGCCLVVYVEEAQQTSKNPYSQVLTLTSVRVKRTFLEISSSSHDESGAWCSTTDADPRRLI